MKRRHEKQGQKRIQDQKKNYFKLLKRLTQGSHQIDPLERIVIFDLICFLNFLIVWICTGKQDAEYENSEEDNINDLKVV